ncbi:MAG TPA: TerB family tellurite resistance protein [Rubricoccaceae bacterium]|nr:TerB family tellurite resistance protein [Rubricoccaceae bacterium]
MRLHELSREQQRAFLILARQVVTADDRLALQEVERLDLLGREMGLSDLPADAPDAVADANYLFETPKARTLALLNLLLVALADGALDEREYAVVRRVAAAFPVAEDEWMWMVDWARRYAALQGEAESFWETH